MTQKHIDEKDTDGFLQIASIQHAATLQIEESIFKQLHEKSIPYRRALLTSLTTPNSSAWINVLPTQPCYTMPNESMRLATRHRLGLLPFDVLRNDKCVCRNTPRFEIDPDHFHSCEKLRRTFHTQRHNNIVQVLQDLAISVGFIAIREPNSHVRPAVIAGKSASSEDYNIHADLLLLKHDLKLYIDVVITRPTQATHLKFHCRVQDTPLHSTIEPSKEKHKKYSSIAEVNQYQLFAFCMESYGGISNESMKLLQTLASHSQEYTPVEFLQHAYRRLSCTLQSSNANIPQLAIQQLHLHRHAAAGNYERWIRRGKRSLTYAQPINADRLAKSMEHSIAAAEIRIQIDEEDDTRIIESSVSDSNSSSSHRSSTPTFVHHNPIGFADCDRNVEFEVEVEAESISMAA